MIRCIDLLSLSIKIPNQWDDQHMVYGYLSTRETACNVHQLLTVSAVQKCRPPCQLIEMAITLSYTAATKKAESDWLAGVDYLLGTTQYNQTPPMQVFVGTSDLMCQY